MGVAEAAATATPHAARGPRPGPDMTWRRRRRAYFVGTTGNAIRPSDAITQTPFEPLSAIKRDGKKVSGRTIGRTGDTWMGRSVMQKINALSPAAQFASFIHFLGLPRACVPPDIPTYMCVELRPFLLSILTYHMIAKMQRVTLTLTGPTPKRQSFRPLLS